MLNVNFECNNPYYVLQLTQSHTILCTKFYDFDKKPHIYAHILLANTLWVATTYGRS